MTANEFKQARISKGLTQRELASSLGQSYSAITKWEIGANPIPKWVAERLRPRQGPVFRLREMTAEELVKAERLAAQKAISVDALASLVIRDFLCGLLSRLRRNPKLPTQLNNVR